MRYYLNVCEKNNLTIRHLQERIKNNEYGRLSDETKNNLIELDRSEINDLIPNLLLLK